MSSRGKRLRAGLTQLICFCLLLTAARSHGWVRTHTGGCHPVFWPQSCVFIQPDQRLYPEMSDGDVLRIMRRSIGNWQSNLGDAYMSLSLLTPQKEREATLDYVPTIKFRTGRWCRPPGRRGEEVCHDPSALAITTLFFVDRPGDATVDGKLLDGDIEMNTVNHRFREIGGHSPIVMSDNRPAADLENTLTHEVGHLIGLEHTCRESLADGIPACTVDHRGRPLMLCSEVPDRAGSDAEAEEIIQATMFPGVDPGETRKRTPETDDLRGVSAAYPLHLDPRSCRLPPIEPLLSGGCAAALRRAVRPFAIGGTLFALGGALVVFMLRRPLRRSRRAPTPPP